MFYMIQPERDLTLVDKDLGGWGGLGNPGPYRYEACKTDERADAFSIYRSATRDMKHKVRIKRFSTREKAQKHLNKLRKRPGIHPVVRPNSMHYDKPIVPQGQYTGRMIHIDSSESFVESFNHRLEELPPEQIHVVSGSREPGN